MVVNWLLIASAVLLGILAVAISPWAGLVGICSGVLAGVGVFLDIREG